MPKLLFAKPTVPSLMKHRFACIFLLLLWSGAIFGQITVTNTDDSGAGSLRQAIDDANLSGSKETIDFNIPGVGPWTITLASLLPYITNGSGVVIDGTTQPGWTFGDPDAMVTVDANGFGYGINITTIDTEIYGLVLTGGSTALNLAFGHDGAIIGAANKGNVISGNSWSGIAINGSDNITIQGNRIGTSVDGLTANGNSGSDGINIRDSDGSLIGGDRNAGEGNVISANGTGSNDLGIEVWNNNNLNIYGNLIGTDAFGNNDFGNYSGGILIATGNNINIGGTGTGEGNVVSGNDNHGIWVSGGTNVKVRNNITGLNLSGDSPIPNAMEGIYLSSSGVGMEITGNTSSGNSNRGIVLNTTGTNEITVTGNFVGTDPSGTAGPGGLGNQGNGIQVSNTDGISIAQPVTISSNVVSGNGLSFGYGINIFGADYIVAQNNIVGLEADGVTPYGNISHGFAFSSGTNFQIGGIGNENIIAHNGGDGIYTSQAALDGGKDIQPNFYYCNSGLGVNIGNASPTVTAPIITSATITDIGGTSVEADGSVIEIYEVDPTCADGQGAVYVGSTTVGTGTWSFNGTFNSVDHVATVKDATYGISEFSSPMDLPDLIVTNTNDDFAGSLRAAIVAANTNPGSDDIVFDPSLDGLTIASLSVLTITAGNGDGTTINGDIDGDGDPDIIISGGAYDGILIQADDCQINGLNMIGFTGAPNAAIEIDGSSGNTITTSYIGTDLTGGAIGAGNYRGISLINGAFNNSIGNGTASGRNAIGGNSFGVYISASNNNTIAGNIIGMGISGSVSVANSGSGIEILNSDGTTIGGLIAGDLNVISRNANAGISVGGGSGTIILGNHIGVDLSGTGGAPNSWDGIALLGGTSDNQIGDGSVGGRNIISANGQSGIELNNASSNFIQGNYIGIASNGTTVMGNSGDGLFLTNASTANTIGGDALAGEGNVISSNGSRGISIATDDNYVFGNVIGLTAAAGTARGNTGAGIVVTGDNNFIGAAVAGYGNVISSNNYGIGVTTGTNTTVLGNIIGLNGAGTQARGNLNEGIRIGIGASVVTIGDGSALGANYISANTQDGIWVSTAAAGGTGLDNNFIGTGLDGVTAFGNGANGIRIRNSSTNNAVGFSVIANNGAHGIALETSAVSNIFAQNSIYNNGGRAIDDASGAALFTPTITSVGTDGLISGTAEIGATVEVYLDVVDEGQQYLATVPVDGGGNWSHPATLGDFSGGLINATATQLYLGYTSEYAAPVALPLGLYEVVNTNDSGAGSLRWAIDNANAAPGANTITFDIPNTDPNYNLDGGTGDETWTITPVTALPAMGTSSAGTNVILDATTQPGIGNFNIALKGSNSFSGLAFGGGGSEVYGFYITDFTAGISLVYFVGGGCTIGAPGKGNTIVNCTTGIGASTSSGHVIQGNFIGTDESGTLLLGNGTGLSFGNWNSNIIIGGIGVGEGNVISGNTGSGIAFNNSSNSQIIGNYIGTDPSGLSAIPNATGIVLGSQSGTQVIDNVISGNTGDGITFNASSTCTVQGNYIGVGADGSTVIANDIGIHGVTISSSSNNTIGGTGAGEGNIIANNTNQGILFTDANHINNEFIANAIFCNGSKGIDLNGFANTNKPTPTITGFTLTDVSGIGTDTDIIHVYRDNSACSPLQGGEYLGTTTVVGGVWSVTGLTLNLSDKINATSTDISGNTSEFIAALPFVTTWQTDNSGTSGTNQITIPTFGAGYSYDIYWEEVGNELANNGTEPAGQLGDYTITFPSIGTYRVEISGTFPRIFFGFVGDREKILTVEQWGDNPWTSMQSAFAGCANLTVPATDTPDLSGVTDMGSMFYYVQLFDTPIGTWDVSGVTNMNRLFMNAEAFNQDISSWDVNSVADMGQMFQSALVFDQDISGWSVGNVTNMLNTFAGATVFNQPIDSWDVSSSTNMRGMFASAPAFNQNLNSWDVSGVTDMQNMFSSGDFNGDIGTWNVSLVANMSYMFSGNATFDRDISGWNVGSVIDIKFMFYQASGFNQDIGTWDVSNVTDMWGMFLEASSFDQDIGSWNVGSVTIMQRMFESAVSFNQNIDAWDVSNVFWLSDMFNGATAFNQNIASWAPTSATTVSNMFNGATAFNQDIGAWDVSNITTMNGMFQDATAFDQNLGTWDIGGATLTNLFDNCGLSRANYDAALIGWEALPSLTINVSLGAIGLTYCSGTTARANLISTYSWTINGDIEDCPPFITTWQTTDGQITIPTTGAGYNYDMTWTNLTNTGVGDNSTTGEVGDYTITGLANGDTYQIDITGDFPTIYFNNGGEKNKILTVEQWGDIGWSSMAGAFRGCSNLTIPASDVPDLTNVTDMSLMFTGASSLNSDISSWDISTITDLRYIFAGASSFNVDIDGWNVSNVTNMEGMFDFATDFNQDLSNWNTSSVMFMAYMFSGAESFNGSIGSWDVSSVTSMESMFLGAIAFNRDISSWNVGMVTDLGNMFNGATSFNQTIGGWDVSNVWNMADMFVDAIDFSGDLSAWNVSNVTDMKEMFWGAPSFNSDISSWNFSSATVMSRMFQNAISFNQDIGNWDVSNVTEIWNMFDGALSFDQSLGNWDVSGINDLSGFLNNSGMSTANYDATLIGWNALPSLQSGVTLGANTLNYCSATAARANIVSSYGWTINDAGALCPEINVFVGSDNTGVLVTDAQAGVIDFGSAPQGSDITLTFAIENTGAAVLDVNSIIISGTAFSTDFITMATIPSGNTITYTITLSAATLGVFNETVTIDNTDDDENPFTFPITGIITAPEIDVFLGNDNTGTVITDAQLAPIDFGSAVIANDIALSFAIENTGNSLLTLTSITSNTTDFTVGGFATSVGAGATETFTITLSGASIGTFNAAITIDSDDVDENPFTFDITGAITATPEPEIAVFEGVDNTGTSVLDAQASVIGFGNATQGTDITQSFTIENLGTNVLNISSITASGTYYSVTSAIATVAVGATETFSVTLSGTTAGTFNTQVTIANDDADENPFTFDIMGVISEITAPDIQIERASSVVSGTVDFGTVEEGNNVIYSFDIINSGNANLDVASITSSDPAFSISSVILPTAITPAGLLPFDITFIANEIGVFTSTITTTSNDPDEPNYSFDVQGSVEGAVVVVVITNPDNTVERVVISSENIDMGQTTLKSDLEKVFGIENLSNAEAITVNSITVDNPAFEIIDIPSTIPPNGFEPFTIVLIADNIGLYTGIVSVSTSINNFSFGVTGEVVATEAPDLNIYNVVTPNGDGVHDFFKIGNITYYENNNVIIYNRWGDKVFETSGYNNQNVVFNGVSNTGNNKELDSGNYYYAIDKGNGKNSETGFIFLKR